MERRSKPSGKYKRRLIIGSIGCFLLAIVCVGFFSGSKSYKADRVNQTLNPKGLEPAIYLETPSEASNKGDVYVVRGANPLEVTLYANVDTSVQVDGSSSMTKKKIQQGHTQKLTSSQFISVCLPHPEQVTLSVNGFIIQTKGLEKMHSFYFKRSS